MMTLDYTVGLGLYSQFKWVMFSPWKGIIDHGLDLGFDGWRWSIHAQLIEDFTLDIFHK